MISIIIPTCRREKELQAAIMSIINQVNSLFEIIVVDNNQEKNNKIQDIVNNFNDSRLKYFYVHIQGCTYARNYGAKISSGSILLFIDDDIEFLDQTTLSRLIETFSNNPIIGVVGSIELSHPDKRKVLSKGENISWVGRISTLGAVQTGYSLLFGHGITEVDHVRSAFMAIRKDVFLQAGDIDRIYDSHGHGFRAETDQCMKIKKIGYKVVVDPQILIWHKGAPRLDCKFSRDNSFYYYYFASKNHFLFMNRFFWKGKFINNLQGLLWGSNRPISPGKCLLMAIRYLKFKNIWYSFISCLGALIGLWLYYSVDKKNIKIRKNICIF